MTRSRPDADTPVPADAPAPAAATVPADAPGRPGTPVPADAPVPAARKGEDDDFFDTEFVDDDPVDEGPLPDLPPLPEDPRWRVEHLPFLTVFSFALMLCAASVGFLNGGPGTALGAAAGVMIVTVSYTMSTLVLAWADTVRPALLMPLGLLTYVLKYTLLGIILAFVISSEWSGRTALGWGVVAGVLGWTAVQVWWVHRISQRK